MSKNKSFIKLLIIIFPVGLIVLGVVSLFLYEKRRLDKVEENPMTKAVTEKGMISHFQKLNDFMSPRGFTTESEITNLVRTAAFIEGSLSPMNTGMAVKSEKALTKAGRIWKEYQIEFEGQEKKNPERLFINYVNASNAEIAVAVSLGEALPNIKLDRSIVLEFTPEGEGSSFYDWVSTAKDRANDNVLMVGGIDWAFLVENVEEFISERGQN